MARAIFTNQEMKYVIVKLCYGSHMILTGYCSLNSDHVYHRDIVRAGQRSGLDIVQVLGGGRICFEQMTKTISVFGESGSYGPAPHKITEQLIRLAMDYEGYTDFTLNISGTYDEKA